MNPGCQSHLFTKLLSLLVYYGFMAWLFTNFNQQGDTRGSSVHFRAIMQLIDTHVHLNFPEYKTTLAEVAARWRAAGVVQLVHSCVSPQEFPTLQAIADQFPAEVYLAVGLHPLDVEGASAQTLTQELLSFAQDTRVVAIGETGLDYYKATNKTEQQAIFEAQIAVAAQLKLPLIIHCRDAAQDCWEILRHYPGIQAVMHCWTGTPEETQLFVDLGCYVSFSGVVTFKSAKAVHASACLVPPSQLLIETDCPFLAPVPQRGKSNEPAFVTHVAQKVADLRAISLATLAEQTTANARRLFQLPPPILHSIGV